MNLARLLRAAAFGTGLALGIAGGGFVSAVASQPQASTAPPSGAAGASAAATFASPGTPVPAAPADADGLLRSDRFRRLAHELRCLVCQNQTLADSNAPLAVDLRNEVLRLMAGGNSDREIKRHLVARYGEFVLYRPTLSAQNLALWAGPFALLAIGAGVIWRLTRTRRPVPDAPAAAATAEIDRLLDGRGPR
jgi:cytochrome c-type biogenesis protein CcmH